jgi:hypothetical protein
LKLYRILGHYYILDWFEDHYTETMAHQMS